MIEEFDVVVIGGGIAGVSIGHELAADRRVCLLEMEATLAYHTTGRSAATWIGTYGSEPVRQLTAASRDFLAEPPAGFCEAPLSRPMGVLHVGGPGQAHLVEALHASVAALSPDVEIVDGARAVELSPVLRPEWAEAGLVEHGALDVDVAALHDGYRRGLKARGGVILTSAPAASAERIGAYWVLTAAGQQYAAPLVVVAAGAWADTVAALFGAQPIGIEPRRRSVFMVGGSGGPRLPMTLAVDESFYFKPDAGQYLCSPADATVQEPGDARPDELQIARAIDALNEATTLRIRSVRTTWAGLRSFVTDRSPAIGYDPAVDGLFWFAGQAGFGIQMGPAAARLGAALVRQQAVPADIAVTGFKVAAVSPARLRRPAAVPDEEEAPSSPKDQGTGECKYNGVTS